MQSILIDLGSDNTRLYIKDELVLEEKTNNVDNITYKDIKELLKKIKKKTFNTKIKLLVLDKKNINLPRKIKVFNKQELSIKKSDIDINKASVTTLVYLDDSYINLSIYALGKMIFNKTISKRNKSNIKKIINDLDIEILSSIKEKGIILTGNVDLDDMYKYLRKDLNIPIFKLN